MASPLIALSSAEQAAINGEVPGITTVEDMDAAIATLVSEGWTYAGAWHFTHAAANATTGVNGTSGDGQYPIPV